MADTNKNNKPKHIVEISPDDFNTLMKATQYSVAMDNYRPIFAYIHIQVTKESILATSLNGCQISRVTIPHASPVEFTAFIKPFTYNKRKLARFTNPIVISDDGNITCLRLPTDFGFIQYEFNHTGQIWSIDSDHIFALAEEHDCATGLDSKLLIKSLSSVIHPKGYVCIETKSDSTKPIILRTYDSGITQEQAILPVRAFDGRPRQS